MPYVIEMLERDEDLRPACFQALVTLEARDSIDSIVPFLSRSETPKFVSPRSKRCGDARWHDRSPGRCRC